MSTNSITTLNQTPMKHRDYLFDNYKALLILLVVVGHFTEPCYRNTEFLNTIKWLIVSFHMPAFIFISGYFSKKELPLSVIIRKLAVPYLVYEIVYYFFYTLILHKKTGLYLLYPKFSLWYLLALFVWRAVTPYIKKIPYYMIFSVIAGLLIGCSGMKSNYLSLPRILFFYPFFLAGMNFTRESVAKIRTAAVRRVSLAGILLFTVFLAFSPVRNLYSSKIFYGRYSYELLEQSIPEGILCRLLCYGIGFFMTFAIMALISEKQTFYSYIGTRTMAIYLFHGLTYSYLKECTTLLKNVDTAGETALLLGFCLVLTVAFSTPKLTAFTNRISNLRLPDFAVSRTKRPRVWLHQKALVFRWDLKHWKPDYCLRQTYLQVGR